MRTSAFLAMLAAAAIAPGSDRQGVFKPVGGQPVEWSVNAAHTMIWAGAPFIPKGMRIAPTLDDVRNAKALGFRDVVVEVPLSAEPPNAVFAELDKSGMRYMVAIDSLAPSVPGFAVEPQGYRVDGIVGPTHVDFPLPGCRSALAVFVVKRDASVDWSKRITLDKERVTMDVDAGNDVERVLLVYPQIVSIAQPDYWQDFDRHRDQLLAMMKRCTFGPGYRGLIDPIGRALRLQDAPGKFVPSGVYFRAELRNYLQKEYKSIETAEKAWSMSSSDIDTFEGLSRLVPLWSGSKGVAELWDPDTDKLYQCDSGHSRVWADIQGTLSETAARRYSALTASVRTVVDAPIVQEWAGWAAPYGSDGAGIAGLGMIVSGGTTNATVQSAARPAGALLDWRTPGWFLTTDLSLEPNANIETVFDDLASIGSRGWFLRSRDPAVLKAAAADAQKTSGDADLAQWSPQPLFFPENATNPAQAQRLPGGKWWLPCPADGNRIDLGTGFSAYREQTRSGQILAMWKNSGTERVRLRMTAPKSASFASIDGSDPQPKVGKGYVEVTMSDYPLIITGTDEIPIPEPALIETEARFEALFAYAESRRRDVTQDQFLFADTLRGFDQSPGGSFAMLREQYWKLNQRIGKIMWIEGERANETNFSGAVAVPGCCNGTALTLNVPVSTTEAGYYASYDMPVNSEDDLEIWLAAKIPKEQRADVRLIVGGEMLRISEPPVCDYGAGFAWYKVGTTRLKGPQTTIRIEVKPKAGADIAIDALLFYPGRFHPVGTAMPDGIAYPTVKPKGRKG